MHVCIILVCRYQCLRQWQNRKSVYYSEVNKPNWWYPLKEYATNEKTFTAFVQDVSHNIYLMRIGKWRRLNRKSLRLNIPTQRFFFAWERHHSYWSGSRFCKRLTWSAGVSIPDVTSFTLILCVLRMCETHCLCESDYIGVIAKFTLYYYYFVSIIG